MIDDQSSMILKRLQCIKNFKTDQKRSGHYNPKEFSNDKFFVVWVKKGLQNEVSTNVYSKY